MQHLQLFENFEGEGASAYDIINEQKVLLVKVEHIGLKEFDDIDFQGWYETDSYIQDCLDAMQEDPKFKTLLQGADILFIGEDYNLSVITIEKPNLFSVDQIDWSLTTPSQAAQFLGGYSGLRSAHKLWNKKAMDFSWTPKYDIPALFVEKYPELYKQLDDRYEAIERGGNMVDFKMRKGKLCVIYSEWDDHEEEGTEETLCTVEELIHGK